MYMQVRWETVVLFLNLINYSMKINIENQNRDGSFSLY